MIDAGPAVQTTVIDDDSAAVRNEQLRTVGVLQDDMRLAGIRARAAEAEAADMRMVANDLKDAIGPLRRVLDPVWDMHRTQVWEGRAADRSRTRLRGHHYGCTRAHGSIDLIIGELETDASKQDSLASTHWQNYNGAQRQVKDLLFDLG